MGKLFKATYRFDSDVEDIVLAELEAHGVNEFVYGDGSLVEEATIQQTGVITCYFKWVMEELAIREAIITRLGALRPSYNVEVSVETIEDAAWTTQWQKYWEPINVGINLRISPSWHLDELPAEKEVLLIDPGRAFGTGTHETTQLCLEIIEQIIKERSINSMLDVGCGTGILSIAASRLGVKNVLGIDISQDAIDISAHNAKINRTPNTQFQFCTVRDVANTSTQFDLVVANLLSSILDSIWKDLLKCVAPNGLLVISGLLFDEITLFCMKRKLIPLSTRIKQDWAALVSQPKSLIK